MNKCYIYRFHYVIPIALFLVGSSYFLFGQGAETEIDKEAYQKKLFDLMDANDDGKVSETEFALATLWGDFQQCDKNNDGKVSKEEYDAHPGTVLRWNQLRPKGKDHLTFKDLTTNKQMIRYMHREWQILLSELKLPKNSRYFKMSDLPDLAKKSN